MKASNQKITFFVDEQRFGPYALWHHQHHFKEVNYAIPLGFIGRFTNWLFVGKKVKGIFDYRYSVLKKYLKSK